MPPKGRSSKDKGQSNRKGQSGKAESSSAFILSHLLCPLYFVLCTLDSASLTHALPSAVDADSAARQWATIRPTVPSLSGCRRVRQHWMKSAHWRPSGVARTLGSREGPGRGARGESGVQSPESRVQSPGSSVDELEPTGVRRLAPFGPPAKQRAARETDFVFHRAPVCLGAGSGRRAEEEDGHGNVVRAQVVEDCRVATAECRVSAGAPGLAKSVRPRRRARRPATSLSCRP